MKIYSRLFKYISRYKYRLFGGIFLSLLVSFFNGASITSLIPIFDTLGQGSEYKFQISLTKNDKNVLLKESKGIALSRLEKGELFLSQWKVKLNQKFNQMTPDELVIFFCLIVFPMYVFKLISLAGTIYFINSAGYLAVKDMREDLYNKVHELPVGMFVREKTGILMSRIINDVESLGKFMSSDLKDAIVDFFYIVTHLMILFYLSWKMFLLVFIVVPLIMGPVSGFADKIRKAVKSQQERLSSLNGHLQEVIAGIRVIRAFSREMYEAERFSGINQELSEKTFKGHFYHQVGPALIELTGSVIIIIFLSFGAYLMSTEGFSRGMFLAFFGTLLFLMRPLKQMGIMFNLVQGAVSTGERVFEIMDMPSDIKTSNTLEFKRLLKGINFNDVSYSYPGSDTLILKNISLSIKKGETVAIVGPSGSGKSTLIDLIPRMFDPVSGSVQFDDKDIREFNLFSIRKKIGIVSQNVFLFNGSIRENILYGNLNAIDSQIKKAAEDAYALDFIDSFEFGFDTMVGERGVMLSGGQRQRISIARTLLLDPEILILDEATSALDTESENLVQKALEKLYKSRTVIVIAHRLSTIKIADKIHYMEDGMLKESGTHSDLMKKDSRYKKLYEMQFE